MFAVIGVAALVFVWTKVPETRGRSLEALEEDVTTVCGLRLWGGGRPADRILFRANSFTRTPDDFGQTVAPAQTPPLQAARAWNSGSRRRGGDRIAGRRPLRRVVLICSLVPECMRLGPYMLT